MPTIKELFAITHKERKTPAIDMAYFPNTTSRMYWSDTPVASSPDVLENVWVLDFIAGDVTMNSKDSGYSYVRAARGGKSAGKMVDNGDFTVTDTATGLMWQQLEAVDENGDVREMNWELALYYCETLELAGYDDWRLPNIIELQSIVDYEKQSSLENPAIDKRFFPNAMADNYWSATTFVHSTDSAWNVSFVSPSAYTIDKTGSEYVRAVRGGQ